MRTILLVLIMGICTLSSAQSFKEKMNAKLAKDKSAMYECGYVQKVSLNPMKALQKGIVSTMTSNSSDLGSTAISVFYQSHLHPQGIMSYPTKTKGWETCGDAVFAGFTNRNGVGLSGTDGLFIVENDTLKSAGAGTYFTGFKPEERTPKHVKITSSDGDEIELDLSPALPIEIVSIDGHSKGQEITFDGSKDVNLLLSGAENDPKSYLHVQLVCKLVGTPIIYDLIVTKAKNRIIIPKEAFKNFEGSPSPFVEKNTLIVNRVTERIIDDSDAGALRTISAYMDWTPVILGGDLVKGNAMTMGFDSTKNTKIDISLQTRGEYDFVIDKAGPYNSPPLSSMNHVAIGSFIVKGNLSAQQVSSQGDVMVKTTKWFPEIDVESWQQLANQLFNDFSALIERQLKVTVHPTEQVVNSDAYHHIKPIEDTVYKSFVEVGAYGTKRILTSSYTDVLKDLSISFPADFVSERLINELNVNAVLAVTVDLNFDFDREALDPKISIVAFAPNVSYKTAAQYFRMSASTEAKSLNDSKLYQGNATHVLSQMIKSEEFMKGFEKALIELNEKEAQYPVYEKLWSSK